MSCSTTICHIEVEFRRKGEAEGVVIACETLTTKGDPFKNLSPTHGRAFSSPQAVKAFKVKQQLL